MKKTTALLFALLFAVLALASCGKKDAFAPPAGYALASDEKADFYFYVGADWRDGAVEGLCYDLSCFLAGSYYCCAEGDLLQQCGDIGRCYYL